jgi:predicted acylesterase/phospholipase RssA
MYSWHEAKMYDSLVLSAGGTYGAAYVGAYKALEARNLTARIKRFHGTSAGAIVATMAACGLTSAEMMRVMDIVCAEKPPKLNLSRLSRDFGAMSVKSYLKSAMDEFLPQGATFVTIAKKHGVTLSVHAYNVKTRKLVDFGLEKTPDADVRECIEASCCVPFMFTPVVIDGERHVDGAVSQRTPMHMVVDPKSTLVLDVKDSSQGEPKDVIQYMTILTAAASRHIGAFDGDFVTISIPEGAPGMLDLPVPRSEIDPLVRVGFEAVDRLLASKIDAATCRGNEDEDK